MIRLSGFIFWLEMCLFQYIINIAMTFLLAETCIAQCVDGGLDDFGITDTEIDVAHFVWLSRVEDTLPKPIFSYLARKL
jgi:hypothetical protein